MAVGDLATVCFLFGSDSSLLVELFYNHNYRIAGIFEGINFRGNAFRKVFADLIFVELGFFAACMACNIKFAVLMFAVHA